MKNIIIDTDPGMDDAVAIMFALGSPSLCVKALTAVSGNLTADRAAANARRVLSLMGVDGVPVARGQQTPLVRPFPSDPFSHGDDGLAELDIPDSPLPEYPGTAADLIVELAQAYAGDITIVAIGPLTNIALALQRDPRLPGRVTELIVLGGSYGFNPVGAERATGDNPVSEWNIYVDPEAAKMVFGAGFNLTAIGLDVATHPKIDLSAAHRAALARSSRKSAWFLGEIARFVERRGFGSYCGLIDSLAVAAAIEPSLFTLETVKVGVETRGELTTGQTVVDRRQHFRWDHLPSIRAASDVDADRFFDLLLRALV